MKKIVLLVLCLFLLIPSISYAGDRYQWIGSDDRRGFFFDTATIEFDKNVFSGNPNYSIVRVWIKTVYTEKGVDEIIADIQARGADPGMQRYLSYAIDRYEFNKDSNTLRFLSGADYKSSGTVIQSYSPQPYAENILPESNGEAWSKAVFKYAGENWKSIPSR